MKKLFSFVKKDIFVCEKKFFSFVKKVFSFVKKVFLFVKKLFHLSKKYLWKPPFFSCEKRSSVFVTKIKRNLINIQFKLSIVKYYNIKHM